MSSLSFNKRNHQQFVSSLTHDLKVPLSIARLNIELACRNSQEDVVTSRLKKSLAQVDRLEKMINDLLEVNRIESGQKLALEIHFINLTKIAKEVLGTMMFLHGDRFQFSAPDYVQGDWCGKALRRMFENLLSNAVKHGDPDRKITVRIFSWATYVEIVVHNYGKPISEEEQKKIFDTYIKTKNGKDGWGLGLATVKEIVVGHHGEISVESDAEMGTSFRIWLPAFQDPRPVAHQ